MSVWKAPEIVYNAELSSNHVSYIDSYCEWHDKESGIYSE